MADTAALVVALSAQLTKFEKDMKKATGMADDAVSGIEKRFAGMNPQINASFLGNLFSNVVTKGIEAATKALTEFYDRFIQIQKQAEITGESMRDIWAFQEVAKAGGATVDNASKSLRRMADLLAEMQRGDRNSLSALFDANPEALRGVNRETLTLKDTMQIVANLIEDTRKGVEKVEVGRLAGLSEDTAISLGKAGTALTAMQNAARDSAPPMEKLAEEAKKFDSYMESAWQWIKADLARGIANTIREIEAIKGFHGGEVNAGQALIPGSVGLKPPKDTGPGTALPRKDVGAAKTDFDRAEKSMSKHIALLEADTAAVGANAGEQERLRAQAVLTEAAIQQYGVVTAETSAKIAAMSLRAGEQRLELAKAQFQFAELSAASKEFGSALAEGFKAAVFEGKALNEVLSNLLKRLSSKLIDKMFDLLFAAPGGGGRSLFLSMFSGSSGGTGGIGHAAEGGPVTGGRPYLIGERGPELMVPGQSGMVIPNNILRGMGSGAGNAFNYAPAIDARGASVEAVARLAQMLQADRAAFASKTIAVIQQARRARMTGL